MTSTRGAELKDPELYAPLARYSGERPPAPAWFDRVIGLEPERRLIDVEGAAIELLTWGERGKPGLMLLHGGRAHADWWSFIAPFFAQDYCVAAISMSGMGRSSWREAYDVEQFSREMIAGAVAAGLFETADPPVFVCHSFGSRPTLIAAARVDVKLRAAIILDAAISPPSEPRMDFTSRPNRIYPSLTAALARFRLMPIQSSEHHYLLDYIARHGLKRIPQLDTDQRSDRDQEEGWTWRFDPYLLSRAPSDTRHKADFALRNARCPVAFVIGERSEIVGATNLAYTRQIAPAGSVFVTLPEAAHHLFLDQPIAVVTALRTLLASWAR